MTCSAFVTRILDTMKERGVCDTSALTKVEPDQPKNFEVGDIVLILDDVIRNKWPMARILKTYSDEEVLVQKVQLVTGGTNLTNKETSILDQPVQC